MKMTERNLDEFVIKAQRAMHKASKFPPRSQARRNWRKIAEGYRRIARQFLENGTENILH
jgi:hypothetical protein